MSWWLEPSPSGPVRYIVEVNFDRIQDETARQRAMSIAASGSLASPDIGYLIALGDQLLEQSSEFQELLAAVR